MNQIRTRASASDADVAATPQRGSRAPAELVIIANGPGELTGWAVPLARAARAWAASQDLALRLSLVLPPCQVASGYERPFAIRQGVFHRIFT
ncbi:MAG TPA: hypothetical protein VNA86_05690, partial [bacterium]|nr:hypothetical protein [bacterium]